MQRERSAHHLVKSFHQLFFETTGSTHRASLFRPTGSAAGAVNSVVMTHSGGCQLTPWGFVRTRRIGRLSSATMNLDGCGRSEPTAHSQQTQLDAHTQPAERAWAVDSIHCRAGESKHPCGLMTLTGRTATKPGACKLHSHSDSVLLAEVRPALRCLNSQGHYESTVCHRGECWLHEME